MAEHVPPRVLVALMAVFFAAMTVAALAFWAAAVVLPGGIGGVIGLIGFGVMTIFGTLHILAAVTGVLLWQWERHRLRPAAPCRAGGGDALFLPRGAGFDLLQPTSPRRCWTESSSAPRLPDLIVMGRRGGGIQVRGQPSSAPPYSDDDITFGVSHARSQRTGRAIDEGTDMTKSIDQLRRDAKALKIGL
jgi:hypothetical protein